MPASLVSSPAYRIFRLHLAARPAILFRLREAPTPQFAYRYRAAFRRLSSDWTNCTPLKLPITMPKPPNTFKKYPRINDAYGHARKCIIAMIDNFNRNQPEGLGFWAKDLPVMNFVRSCIPSHLSPPELGSSTKDIQSRMRAIVYPLIESKQLCDREFSSWILDDQRIRDFAENWFRTKSPSKPRGRMPHYGIEDFVKARLMSYDSVLVLRAHGKEYQGTITPNFGIQMDLGNGTKKFKSPNEVISKGLNSDFGPWKCFWIKDSFGNETLLDEIRQAYAESRSEE